MWFQKQEVEENRTIDRDRWTSIRVIATYRPSSTDCDVIGPRQHTASWSRARGVSGYPATYNQDRDLERHFFKTLLIGRRGRVTSRHGLGTLFH